ncbi:hypothetical protein S7711_01321 [Stachybotrys chartarum IBT 7711]|uniref:Major facilitator superfamily (MFS) profile domain-containing protein n=1 Tax=Stachybotrys chartarum (strain CBS 109288 / IBT 7711) TaxID=1280523 RepID=A0A084BBP5_STACB|nr:hypothetical protein S7711_01321 [Stachybotrys chartarum IBT 7711]
MSAELTAVSPSKQADVESAEAKYILSTRFMLLSSSNCLCRIGHDELEFDAQAENKLRLKIDWMILPTVFFLYLFCFIDRANIGNARIAGLERDLNMQGFDYNATLSIFYISYIIFEIPSNILCKIVGPGWFIPILTILFGACSIATSFVQTTPQLMGVRFLLGLFEAGMPPGTAYYLSRWYRRSELTFRLSVYIVSAPVAGAFGGLLASAILRLDSVGSLREWRMIFVIEGIVTVAIGIIGLFTLADRPESARWLTAEQKELAEKRVLSERVGQTQVLDKLDKRKFVGGMWNPVVIPTAVIFLFANITVHGLAVFTPTIIRSIYPDETPDMQQLYTVPPYIVGSFFTILIPYISWKMDQRQILMILSAPLGIIGYIMFISTTSLQVRYGATFLIASSIFSLGALTGGQVSANVVSDTARSAGFALNVMLGNIGGLISTWSFLPFDAPNYYIGNGLNLGTTFGILSISTFMYFWMKRNNIKRSRREEEELNKLDGMSQEQMEDLEWRHPSFRWKI